MNIFRDRTVSHAFWLLGMLVLWHGTMALGLDGHRTLTQYVHNSWGAEKGLDGGAVYAIGQSSDGYLWLGTEQGLVRFDGSDFTLMQTPLPGRGPTGAVRGLVEDAEGSLWVRLDGPRLLRYRNGVFEDPASRVGWSDATVTAMSRDSRGELLLWGPRNRTAYFHQGRFERIAPRDQIKGIVISMLETGDALWLGTRDVGLYRIEGARFLRVLSERRLGSVNALAPSEHGGVWIGTEAGLRLWEHGTLVNLHLCDSLDKAQVFALTRDRHHNLWVGTDRGLYRIDLEREVVTGYLPSTAGTEVSAIYEDKEGDLWFGSVRGLERLRDGMFTSYPVGASPLKENGGPIFVDDAGLTWFAPLSGGLYCLEDGRVRRVAVPELANDVIYSITGAHGELWLGRQQGGLTELTRQGNGWTARTFTRNDGLAQNSVYTITRARDGSIWAGTVSGGVSVLRHGHFETYTSDNGLQSNAIFSSMQAADGTMWFASPSGLVSFNGDRWITYGVMAESSPNVRTVFEDSGHVLWIGTSYGLARFVHGRIEPLRAPPQVLTEEVLGIGQDAQGFLWLVTPRHVLQVDRESLLRGTLNESGVLSYAAGDGLLETEGVRRDRSLISDRAGRIWISLPHSVAVADVATAEGYRWPVDVRIDSAGPTDPSLSSKGGLGNLSPDIRSITFRFSGTNMAMLQRTRFRYRLDGSDQEWSKDSSLRQVTYAHLTPGRYTFRIMASNGLGIWNAPETDVPFRIWPAFLETWYFRLLGVLLLAMTAIGLYRIRVFHLKDQLNRRFQDRLAERTRIAQDLHDTLLQGVLSASLQLDITQDRLPEESAARPMLQRVLQLLRQVTKEGRDALRGLRSIDSSMSLEAALGRLADEALLDHAVSYRVHAQGDVRALRQAVRDEVYRIGREASCNAFSHAKATSIVVMIEYGSRAFHLIVSDNGRGIDASILKNGREGHWGLAGMRERAHAIGAVLKVRSRVPGGTEVELVVPAIIAYADRRSRKLWPSAARIE